MLPVIVGITGASGSILAKKCIEKLVSQGHPLATVCTNAGRYVWEAELRESFDDWIKGLPCQHYHIDNIAAPIASGTFVTQGMIVIPCSMGTLASMAHGLSQNLLERAADVIIKERRPLVIVPRESPLSPIHLRNMLTLAQLGAKLVLPVPAFYAHPKTLEEYIDQTTGRVLEALGLTGLAPHQRYAGDEGTPFSKTMGRK
ncbi:MAG: UbiX family flavin prenyltransferase [Chloroflexi bacterium]|nr:UbiX family flavin prenyltransferase [Chloroflexota bacterium]